MAEGFLDPEIETIIARTEDISLAYARAETLEAEAKALREDSVENQALAFEDANNVLLKRYAAGELSPLEVVGAVATLGDLDPDLVGLYHGKRADKIVSVFEALQPGEPVMRLQSLQEDHTGIVAASPKVGKVVTRKKSRDPMVSQPFMAPWGEVKVPLRVIDKAGKRRRVTAEVEIGSLVSAVVGRAAIQAAVEAVSFATRSDGAACHPGTVTNSYALRDLKAEIDTLHGLGMEPISTQALDEALEQAAAYADGQRRRFADARFPRGSYTRRYGREQWVR